MRALLALSFFLALPVASAQTGEREIETVIVDGDETRVVRYRVEADTTDDPRSIVIKMDSVATLLGGLLRPDGPIGSRMRRFEIALEDGELRMESGGAGVDKETRERMAELSTRARRLAAEARDGDRAAERELDDVLAELFDARGDMRRQRAQALRERADELREQAEELDAEAARRAQDRRRIIEARKREMMGEDAASDW